jgi:ABC-type transport system involved in multi-copper enzyme maturation permease subunit
VREMARRFLRQKLGSPGTIIALGLMAVIAALPLNAGQAFSGLDTVAMLVLAAGCVSRDAASGALQMILSRPIRRIQYLAGRYVGLLACFLLFLGVSVVLAITLGQIVAQLSPGPAPPMRPAADFARVCAAALLQGALLAAIVLFFSTFLRGWGDVLAVAVFGILFGSLRTLGQALRLPAVARAGELARDNLSPSVPWDSVLHGQRVFGEATGRYILALLLYWTLAAVIFSRREFSYGQD